MSTKVELDVENADNRCFDRVRIIRECLSRGEFSRRERIFDAARVYGVSDERRTLVLRNVVKAGMKVDSACPVWSIPGRLSTDRSLVGRISDNGLENGQIENSRANFSPFPLPPSKFSARLTALINFTGRSINRNRVGQILP